MSVTDTTNIEADRTAGLIRLTSAACDVDVVSFEAREALSAPIAVSILGYVEGDADTAASALLGASATLSFALSGHARRIPGVVTHVELTGTRHTTRDASLLRVTLSTHLALLASRVASRVFQSVTVQEIVDTILAEWDVPRRWALARQLDGWSYAVQHQESDLAFVSRLLAAEGIFFAFEDGGADTDGLRVVFGDSPAAYGVAARDARGRVEPALAYARTSKHLTAGSERVTRFSADRRLRPERAIVRDHTVSNADVVAERAAAAGEPATRANGGTRTVYAYLPPRAVTPTSGGATLTLEQARRDALVYRGDAASARLAVGCLFGVEDHDERSLDGDYLLTELVTHGVDPRHLSGSEREATETLRQEITAIRATDVQRPAVPPRPPHHGLDTAIVVGPDGAPVATDGLGRVRVRFHWDWPRPGVPDARNWEERSTWLRVSQPWGGPGHGTQFLPRVGSEVIVGYIGGDLNRPVVLGCVPNDGAPPPFSMPADASKTGLVSVGLASDLRSELVFDDAAGRESARLASARIEVESRQDLRVTAGRDARTEVGASSYLNVVGDRHEAVDGERHVEVKRKSTVRALEDASLDVDRNASARLGGVDVRVERDVITAVMGSTETTTHGDVRAHTVGLTSSRHEGPLLVTVGEPDLRASHLVHVEGTSSSFARGRLSIESPEIIELRSGASAITIGPESVQIRTPKLRVDASDVEIVGDTVDLLAKDYVRTAGKRVLILSSGASVCLTKIAKVHGAAVKLGAPPDALDGPEAAKLPPPPTRVTLKDQDGNPVAGERFLVRLLDGTTRAGVTGSDGTATIEGLKGQCSVEFIDLPSFEEA